MADATDLAAGVCFFFRRKSRGVSRPDDDGGFPVTQLGSREFLLLAITFFRGNRHIC